MRKIRDVLRLKLEARLSHEQTAAALNISKGVVTKYLALANTAGLNWAQIQALDDTALHNRMLGSPKRVSGFVQPDYGLIRGSRLSSSRSTSGSVSKPWVRYGDRPVTAPSRWLRVCSSAAGRTCATRSIAAAR